MRSRNESTRARDGGSSSRSSDRRAAVRTRAMHSALKRHWAASCRSGDSAPSSTSSCKRSSVRPEHCDRSTIVTWLCACSQSVSGASGAMRFHLGEMAAGIEGRGARELADASAAQCLAALPAQAQSLPVGRGLRDARLDRPGHVPHAALVVVLRHLQAEIDLGAAVGVLERKVDGDLVVFPGNRDVRAVLLAAPSAREAFEQLREVQVVEGELAALEAPLAELLFPIRRRAEFLAGLVGGSEL